MRRVVRRLIIRRPRLARRACRLSIAAFAVYVAITGCEYSGYSINATFCDDWCRVMRRTGCEQEPENCIRDCESAKPSDRCFDLQSSLLDCYESTPADRFECVGQGFQSTVRPRPEICTEQRHALIRCEVPRVMECVDACLAIAADDPAVIALDAGPPPLAESPASPCPQPPFPCERLCWELDARFGRGRPTTLSSIDTSDDTNLSAIGAPLIRCAQARAADCRSALAASPSEGPPSASPPTQGTSADGVSWTSAFLECAGLPADVGLLD
jgi:hypothetical protein